MKKRFILPQILILVIQSVFAYGIQNHYSPFSITGLLSNYNLELMTDAVLFIIFFMAIQITLSKTHIVKKNSIKTLLTIILSSFAIYAVMKSNIQISYLFFNLGIGREFITKYFPWFLLIIAIFIVIKKGFKVLFLFLGLFFIISAFFVYQSTLSAIMGIVFLLIALILHKKRGGGRFSKGGLIIVVHGARYKCGFGTKKIKMRLVPHKEDKIIIENSGKEFFNYQIKTQGGISAHPIAGKLDPNYSQEIKTELIVSAKREILIIAKSPKRKQKAKIIVSPFEIEEKEPTNEEEPKETPPPKKSRIDILIKEAKNLKKWAEKQQRPQLYKTWAKFINWLKQRGYGNNEIEIMKNLNVTKKDIQRVVRKYIL